MSPIPRRALEPTGDPPKNKEKEKQNSETCQSDFHIVLAWNCLEKSCFYSNTNSVQGHETENVRKNARKLTRSSLKHIREGKTDFFPKKIILMGSYHF